MPASEKERSSHDLEYEKLTVIIPTLNEAETIGQLVDELTEHYSGIHLIIADDDSTDRTREEVQLRSGNNPRIHLLWRKGKSPGLTASVVDALGSVSTNFFAVMDGDLQHPSSVIESLLQALNRGYPVAVATSQRQELSPLRYLISRSGTLMGRLRLRLSGSASCSDCMSGCFAGRTTLFTEIIRRKGNTFESGGYKVLFDFLKQIPSQTPVAEVGYQFGYRSSGESKLSFPIMLRYIRSLFR